MSIMTAVIFSILAMILVLGPLVALHEWGHYIVARMCGVKVLTYSIGFGPKLVSWTSKKTGIDYRISALPLGGYVKMLDGREGEIPKGQEHLAFDRQHPLKKIAIVFAGPAMNFIIAIALFWLLFLSPSTQLNTRIGSVLPDSFAATAGLQVGDKITAIDNKAVNTWSDVNYQLANRMGESSQVKVTVLPYKDDIAQSNSKNYQVGVREFMQAEAKGKDALSAFGITPWQPSNPPKIAKIIEGGSAQRQGMQVGDVIVAINGVTVDNWSVAVQSIQDNPETLMTFKVLRANKPLELKIMPQGKKDIMGYERGSIGVQLMSDEVAPASYQTVIEYNAMAALGKSFEKTWTLSAMTLNSMGKMVTGLIGLDNLSGPITIAKVTKQSFEISWQMVLSTAGLLSLSLAVLNLLPIPVLDGGHLLYYLIELVRGKPLSEQTQIIGFNIGFIIMLGFMLVAIGMDLSKF